MKPPSKALAFLRWFCRKDYLEEIEGDLIELFDETAHRSPRRARWQFRWHVLRYFRPEFIRSFKDMHQPNSIDMFRNYFRVALRSLIRNNGYSFINIGGLALGMTVTMLIGLWIHDELSFNKYHKNYDSIGQIWGGGTDPGSTRITGTVAVPLPMATILKNDYQRYFKHVLLGWWIGEHGLSTEDKKLTKVGEFIERGAPEMLSLKMINGDYNSLGDPHSIILSASTARAFFGTEDPMNKVISINNSLEVKVTGVYEDIPNNNRFSEVQFFAAWDLWFSANPWMAANTGSWTNRSFNIYVQLHPGITMEEANLGLHDFFYKNLPKDFLKEAAKYKPFAQILPMSTWHLYSELEDGKPSQGRITFVWLFGIVGAFVLLLACINFINLSTARSEKRAREVGVRKSIGSGKSQLVLQFLSESFMVVLGAFILSMILLILSQTWFNDLSGKDIRLPFDKPFFWLIMIGFVAVTGFMSGLYPAFYLSSFQPVKVLKGTLRPGRFSSLPRKVLVVLQFTVSVVLIIGTIVVFRQIDFARNRPVGYNGNGLVTAPLNDPNFAGRHEVIRNELLRSGVLAEVSYSSNPLTGVWSHSGGFNWEGRDPEKDNSFGIISVNHEFGKTIDWEFISGRDFSRDGAGDTAAVIINETAARYLGLTQPVGEFITHEGDNGRWQIIGVVKDLVMESPYYPVKQSFFFLDHRYREAGHIVMKMNKDAGPATAMPQVQQILKGIIPSFAFDYRFVDHEYMLKFRQEERIGQLSGIFAVLAIFISCLGMFGLASFVAERRTKEIGIRKVLGASVMNLWKMLSTHFVMLVLLACVIATPVSYYLIRGWLDKYTYHTEMSWWIFAATMGGALGITLLTISFQALRAATMNPVKSLRSE
jgi:putative ABC transport system permease protein